jgi:hypothetical protein
MDIFENTARNNACCVAIVGYHGKSCLSGCYLDTDLRKRYLVTEVHNMWEVSMGGSHTGLSFLPRAHEVHSSL